MKLIHKTIETQNNVIVMGDFNFDNPAENRQNIDDCKHEY